MAVDTQNKRASCLGLALAVTLTLPVPDGTVATADRAHTTYCYAGIAAGAAVSIDWMEAKFLAKAASVTVTAKAASVTWSATAASVTFTPME